MNMNLSLGLSFIFSLPVFAAGLDTRLINGKPVQPGMFDEVVQIRSLDSLCTATVVGPRAIMTAAHCAPTGATAEFKVKGVTYKAKITRSSLFSSQDHDISIGITDKEITGIQPASVGGAAQKGLGITILGYGCTTSGGGETDGVLRYGETVVTGFSNFDLVSQKPDGAALCFGDSGGPAFVFDRGRHLLLGINSKGNIKDTNYNTRTDVKESQDFIKSLIDSNQLEICGVNKVCGAAGPIAPSCQLSASPDSIVLGQSLVASLRVSGEVSEARIDNQVVSISGGTAQRTLTPSTVGNFTIQAQVTGAGGSGSCSAAYTVKQKPPVPVDPPQCQVTVTPNQIKLGETVVARLTSQGQVTSAELNGQSVSTSGAEVKITPPMGGNYSVKGKVSGPGGSAECFGNYSVDGPTPNVPNYTVVPTYCGDNTITETQVRQACLALVKYSYMTRDITLKEVILVTYRDGSQEIMPLLIKTPKRAVTLERGVEQWVLYANNSVVKSNNLMLDTRTANVTLGSTGSLTDVPIALSGRTIKNGQAFNVDNLKKAMN